MTTEAIEIIRKEGLSFPVRAPCLSDSIRKDLKLPIRGLMSSLNNGFNYKSRSNTTGAWSLISNPPWRIIEMSLTRFAAAGLARK